MTTTKRLNAFLMRRMSFSGLFLFIYFNYAQFCVQRANTIRRSYLDASNYTHRRIQTSENNGCASRIVLLRDTKRLQNVK